MRSDLRLRFGRHGVTALAVAFAAGALVQDLVSPTVTLDSGRYDRGPEAVIAAVLVGAVSWSRCAAGSGVIAPLSAIALFGLATLTARAWVLDSAFVYLLAMLICGLGGYLTTSPLTPGRPAGHPGGRRPGGLAASRPLLGSGVGGDQPS